MKNFLTRSVWLVSLISLFTDIASEMLYPVMPVFLKSIGFSIVMIGILEGVAEATAGLSKGYFGNRSDISGKRVPFIRWGYILSAVSKPMMAILTFPWWIFVARTFDRLGKGIRTSARDALLSDETTSENKGKVFGFHRALDTLGASIGPVLALIFLWKFPANYKWLFILAFLPGIIAVSLTFLLKDKARSQELSKPKINFLQYLKYWKFSSVSYKKLIVALLLFTLFNSSDAFLLLFLKYKGYSDLQMIGFYIFYNILYAALSYPLGALADKMGLKKVLVFGMVIFSLVYGGITMANSTIFFIIVFGFYALYAAATEGISKALISNLVKKEHIATALGFYSSFASFGTLIASTLAGLLWFSFSPETLFLVSAVGVIVVALYMGLNKFEYRIEKKLVKESQRFKV